MFKHRFRNNKRNIYVQGQLYFSFNEYVELPEIINNCDIEYINNISESDNDTNIKVIDDTVIVNVKDIIIENGILETVSDDLSSKNIKELRLIAKELGIKDLYKLSKLELIQAIQEKK